MNNCCFICNCQSIVSLRNSSYLFGNSALESGSKLHEIVSEIIEKPLKEGDVHSGIICRSCYKVCSDYDATKMSLISIKLEMLNQFKSSISNHNIGYDTYEADVKNRLREATTASKPKKAGRKVVLSSSKLQPLPPDLLLKLGKFVGLKTGDNNDKEKPSSPPVATTTASPPVTTSENKMDQHTFYLSNIANIFEERTNSNSSSDLAKGFSLSNLTKELESEATVVDEDDDSVAERGSSFDERDIMSIPDNTNEDDVDPLKMDTDCAFSVMPVTSTDGNLVLEVKGVKPNSNTTSDNPSNSDYMDIEMLKTYIENQNPEGDNKYVLGELEILNQGDDDQGHTIVIYDGSELSLVVPDDGSRQGTAIVDNGDSQDSNEESQIELQVSGDEETANAIIAAAQEQGGAFIKVGSGEMFRVQSVQSKIEEDDEKRQPLKMVTKEGDKFSCVLCENGIKNGKKLQPFMSDAKGMMHHLKVEHDARLYICSLCGIPMRKRSDYSKHVMSVHGSRAAPAPEPASDGAGRARAHACGVCGRAYNSRTLLAEHANTHSGARPHSCWRCGKAFASKYTLHAHMKTHAERPRPYKCSKCPKTFFTQQNLGQHEKTHSGVKDFICNVCNKAFSTQHNLEVHGVVHSKSRPHRCTVCPKAFARAAELRDHSRTHTGERPFSCDLCGASFTQRSNLHSHRRATHFGEKPHKCPHCAKRFKRRRLLDYHIKATHTGERPLECETCHSTFVYPEHYKKHIRIHSGEKPYQCEICGKAFTSRDNRNTHRFTHSDKKPYECLACGAGFMRKNLLYAHMNASGHLAESIVVNQPRVTKVSAANINAQIVDVQSAETRDYDAVTEMFQAPVEVNFDGNKTEAIVKNEVEEFFLGDKKFYIQNGKTAFNLVQTATTEDSLFVSPSLITEKTETTLLENVNPEQLAAAEIIPAETEDGVFRLIQVKLPNGNNGWMAVNN